MADYADKEPGGGGNGLWWDVRELKRWRKEDIDPLKLPVVVYELEQLGKDVRAMTKAFYTFAFAVVGSSIAFAFTVFALLGNH